MSPKCKTVGKPTDFFFFFVQPTKSTKYIATQTLQDGNHSPVVLLVSSTADRLCFSNIRLCHLSAPAAQFELPIFAVRSSLFPIDETSRNPTPIVHLRVTLSPSNGISTKAVFFSSSEIDRD